MIKIYIKKVCHYNKCMELKNQPNYKGVHSLKMIVLKFIVVLKV